MDENGLGQANRDVSVNTVYSEIYTEMRRHRDYQFANAQWYTTLLLALIGVILTTKYGGQSPGIKNVIDENVGVKLIITFVTIIVCINSCFTILYSHKRYEKLREYTDKTLEPNWKKFTPEKTIIQPHNALIFNQILLSIFVIVALCLPV